MEVWKFSEGCEGMASRVVRLSRGGKVIAEQGKEGNGCVSWRSVERGKSSRKKLRKGMVAKGEVRGGVLREKRSWEVRRNRRCGCRESEKSKK